MEVIIPDIQKIMAVFYIKDVYRIFSKFTLYNYLFKKKKLFFNLLFQKTFLQFLISKMKLISHKRVKNDPVR